MEANKLVDCTTCKKQFAMSADKCIHCGAENTYVHPKIAAVAEKIYGLPLGEKYSVDYKRNVMRITINRQKKLANKDAGIDLFKAIGFFILLGISNGLDTWVSWAGYLQVLFLVGTVFYFGKFAFKFAASVLFGDPEGILECQVTINSNNVPVFRSNNKDTFAPVYKLFNEEEEKEEKKTA